MPLLDVTEVLLDPDFVDPWKPDAWPLGRTLTGPFLS